jgi:hypothetical protein
LSRGVGRVMIWLERAGPENFKNIFEWHPRLHAARELHGCSMIDNQQTCRDRPMRHQDQRKAQYRAVAFDRWWLRFGVAGHSAMILGHVRAGMRSLERKCSFHGRSSSRDVLSMRRMSRRLRPRSRRRLDRDFSSIPLSVAASASSKPKHR